MDANRHILSLYIATICWVICSHVCLQSVYIYIYILHKVSGEKVRRPQFLLVFEVIPNVYPIFFACCSGKNHLKGSKIEGGGAGRSRGTGTVGRRPWAFLRCHETSVPSAACATPQLWITTPHRASCNDARVWIAYRTDATGGGWGNVGNGA